MTRTTVRSVRRWAVVGVALTALGLAATGSVTPAMAGAGAQRQQSGKVFGLALSGVPQSMHPLNTLIDRIHRKPNYVSFYLDWADPFKPAMAKRVCRAGMRPMLTWESWDWADTVDGATAVTQPAYAPRKIAAGRYDHYVRVTAKAIKHIGCPLVLRFDHEVNGDWYPWGIGTPRMHNTAKRYVRMWRHVWRIFHRHNVDNVTWVWSPNQMRAGPHKYTLSALYPGSRYVDMVGLDGYLVRATDTPGFMFGPLMQNLRPFAANKPWLVAETGVATGLSQPQGIQSLLQFVADNKRLRGFVYLDEPKTRADWTFENNAASLRAFRRGVHAAAYQHSGT